MMNTEHFVFLCLHLSEGQQLDFDQSNKNTSLKKGLKKSFKICLRTYVSIPLFPLLYLQPKPTVVSKYKTA